MESCSRETKITSSRILTKRNKTAQEMDLETKRRNEINTCEREGHTVANLISEINETARHVEAKYNDISFEIFPWSKSI